MKLISNDLRDGDKLPHRHVFNGMGYDGDNVSPHLAWDDVPAGTKSFVVTCYDPDAPTGSGWWHWVVVNGPSGSGKSTFLRCLNLLEVPTEGKIIFEGNDITDKKNDINKLRQKMGMVFQQFNLFPHKTVLENITISPIKVKGINKEEANKKAMELLKMVGLVDKAEAYPSSLSGGQKQRIADS